MSGFHCTVSHSIKSYEQLYFVDILYQKKLVLHNWA